MDSAAHAEGVPRPTSAPPRPASGQRGYRPIADYAAIGDCHGSALVARDGGIDWCALGRFDNDPVFCRLLDAKRGGHLATQPRAAHSTTRAYLRGTNVLRTEFESARGKVALVDFMPVGRKPGAMAHDYVSLNAPHWLVRRIEGVAGQVDLDIEYVPSLDFGATPARLSAHPEGIAADPDGPMLYTDLALATRGARAAGHTRIRAGETRYLVVAAPGQRVSAAAIEALYRVTCAFWTEWIGYCRYRGPHAEMVARSALALKLMSYAPSGASVAALTTSLPEHIGGERNWDYRYCWVRDASLALHALSALGYSGEARCFFGFLCGLIAKPAGELQVMVGIDGERVDAERTLEHLEGYRASRPVRSGNGAATQLQTDLYGYILEGALVYRTLGGKLSDADAKALAGIVEVVRDCWQRPDSGLWEVRSAPSHFVHSKAMCWVAVDCAIRLLGAQSDWAALRERIWQSVLCEGLAGDGRFMRAYGDGDADSADAALLQLPMLGLPAAPQDLRRTRDAVERALASGDLMHRYRASDGLPGREGAFLVASFWRVDALLHEGRMDDAQALFERLLALANDVGLYAEQIDAVTHEFLGNFPQAFTHLGLLGAAVNLALAQRKGSSALRGGYADRARRSAGATFGWRGVLAAFLRTGRLALVSSRKSQLVLP